MSSVSESGRRETKKRSNLNRQSTGSNINSAAHACRRRKPEDYSANSLFTVGFSVDILFFCQLRSSPGVDFGSTFHIPGLCAL